MSGAFWGKSRLRAALLAVLLVVAAPWCVSALLDVEQGFCIAQEVSGANSAQTRENASAQDFIDFQGNAAYSAVRFSEETGICGFESSFSAEETSEAIRAELERKGWACTLQQQVASSFSRAQGTYCWALVSCGTVEGKTVVVCHLA